MLEEKTLEWKYEKLFQKLHRCVGHKKFLTECLEFKLYPKFTRIVANVVKQLSLTRGQIFKMRSKQLQNALELQNKNEKSINLHLYHIFSILSSLIHHKTLALKMKNIVNRVIDREKLNPWKLSTT